jgi:hypothetical protein
LDSDQPEVICELLDPRVWLEVSCDYDHPPSLLCPGFGYLQDVVGLSASVRDTGGRRVSPVPVGGHHHDPAGAFGWAWFVSHRYPVLTREFTIFLQKV